MKLNRKLWTAALAVAMTTPSAMAAQDTAGMHYTSASEGFYASIRLRYVSNGGTKDGGADIQNGSSRFGVRGTNDLGGGLEGFYQYEAGVGTENGSDLSTRLGHVGLRGDFGEVVAGSFWTNTYNWVDGSTDIANRHSGGFAYDGYFGQARSSKSIQYTTPNLNGFQGAILIKADPGSDGEGEVKESRTVDIPSGTVVEEVRGAMTVTVEVYGRAQRLDSPGGDPAVKNPKDDDDIDHWSIAAKYDIAGFSTAFSFSRQSRKIGHDELVSPTLSFTRETGRKDLDSWAVKLGYSQDNWYVNGWYGEIGLADGGVCNVITVNDADGDFSHYAAQKCGDSEVFSMAGGISVDKVNVYAVYENMESDYHDKGLKRGDDTNTTLGVQYTLGSNSWTWVEYAGRDSDSKKGKDDDFSIGLGHSF